LAIKEALVEASFTLGTDDDRQQVLEQQPDLFSLVPMELISTFG